MLSSHTLFKNLYLRIEKWHSNQATPPGLSSHILILKLSQIWIEVLCTSDTFLLFFEYFLLSGTKWFLLYFPCLALESPISPRGSGFFYWRMKPFVGWARENIYSLHGHILAYIFTYIKICIYLVYTNTLTLHGSFFFFLFRICNFILCYLPLSSISHLSRFPYLTLLRLQYPSLHKPIPSSLLFKKYTYFLKKSNYTMWWVQRGYYPSLCLKFQIKNPIKIKVCRLLDFIKM